MYYLRPNRRQRWNRRAREAGRFELLYNEIALINRYRFQIQFSGSAVTVKVTELSSGLIPEETFTGAAVP